MTASRRPLSIALVAVLMALAVIGSGCASKPEFKLRYEPQGAALTSMAAEELAAGTDIAAVASITTSDAPEVRDQVLTELRAKGADGTRAADLLTEGFPARTAAVPVLVRFSSVDGTSAVVVVEAWGDEGGTLTHRRLWVFAKGSGAIMRAASFR